MPGKAKIVLLAAICCLCSLHVVQAAPTVRLRINTTHSQDSAIGAVHDAGLSPAEVSVSHSSLDNGKTYLPPPKMMEDAKSAGATIMSSSYSGWHYSYDSFAYSQLSAAGMVHVYAYVPKKQQPESAPPPAVFSTVTVIGGPSGGGIEFGIPAGYMHGKGQGSTPSEVTAQLAGLMASLKYRHPSWNWFDVKAALRGTAANYATGYDPNKYGYGAINYEKANTQSNATQLELFAPAAILVARVSDQVIFQINPFKQSRRIGDVLFKFPTKPAPTLKEMTQEEITAMGGQFVYSSYLNRDANTFSFRMAKGETAYLVWFTQDASSKFSRIEAYSIFGPFTYQ